MSRKFTQIEVENYFKKENCELLDNYIDCKSKMKYICCCGRPSITTFDNFKRKKRCAKCGVEKNAELLRNDIEYVRETFIKSGCVPLFETYKNTKQKLEYICSCGNPSSITFSDFVSGRRCLKCAKERRMATNIEINNVKTSLQQNYINKLIGGKLNYQVGASCLDIAFPEEMIYLEYDGSGHDLSVKLKSKTQEEFDEYEKRRKYALYRRNWKEIRIKSKQDLFPTDEKLLEIINFCKNILKEHSWVIVNIDAGYIECNELVISYDFGKLKRLRRD